MDIDFSAIRKAEADVKLGRYNVHVKYDQLAILGRAITGMQERAVEGLRNAAEATAKSVRQRAIEAVSRETSLDRDLIDQAISTGGSAADQSWLAYFFSPLKVFVPEEDNLGPSERVGGVDPKATVSMHFSEQRYPLSEFEVELTAEGVSATIFTQKGATDIPHAFLIGDFEGEYFRRTTPDSYPLEMLFGPSVATIAANTPGLIERLQQDGRVELVKQVKRERDRIVNEFLAL